jgi:hypothetical protein
VLSGQFELEVSACLALVHALDLRLGKLPVLTDAHQTMNAVEIIVEFRRLPEDEKQKKLLKDFLPNILKYSTNWPSD